MNGVWLAFLLTLFAGLATAIGSVIAFTAKRTNYRFLSVATGFSGGVMLYVSFVEIFFKGADRLIEVYGDRWGMWLTVGAFFGGLVLMGLIDNLIPSAENPHEVHAESEMGPLRERAGAQEAAVTAASCAPADPATPPAYRHGHSREPGIHAHASSSASDLSHRGLPDPKLLRLGLFTALAIGIHNFPEGLVTFLAVLQDPALGVAIAIAIALHNIPEGISVSVPIYYATGNQRKAFFYSVASGLAEVVGALIAYGILTAFLGPAAGFPGQVVGVLFALVAGVMVYISLDELLPTSRAYGRGHDSLFGLVGGMAVMALSLLLLR